MDKCWVCCLHSVGLLSTRVFLKNFKNRPRMKKKTATSVLFFIERTEKIVLIYWGSQWYRRRISQKKIGKINESVFLCVMKSNEMTERKENYFIHKNRINGQFSILLLVFFMSFFFCSSLCTVSFLVFFFLRKNNKLNVECSLDTFYPFHFIFIACYCTRRCLACNRTILIETQSVRMTNDKMRSCRAFAQQSNPLSKTE